MNLNKQQQEAINAPLGPTLVIAGAGTGKTTVLIQRIVFLLNSGIDQDQILVITFTNKARDEIRSRVSKYAGVNISHVYTFHGFFYRFLKKYQGKIPNRKNFRVVDESDQRSICRKAIKEVGVQSELLTPRTVKKIISDLKTIFRKEVETSLDRMTRPFMLIFPPHSIKEIYIRYQKYLQQEDALDYDDLEVFSYELLKEEGIRESINKRYSAILIDEFQDTSDLQLKIVKKLAEYHRNIFCVGDPDQSIYGFRGAKPRVCSEFLEIFKGAKIVKLEENYRSTKNILKVSNHLINNRPTELSKNLFTNNEEGAQIFYKRFFNEREESEWVLDQIEKIKETSKSPLKSFVILYRNNRIARPFELELNNRKKFPFNVTNATEFFEREEIKVVISYLDLVLFDRSMVAFDKVRDKPSKGIGEESLKKFEDFIKSKNLSITEGIDRIEECEGLKKRSQSSFKKFGETLKSIRDDKDSDIRTLINSVVEKTGYKNFLEEKKELGRLENINDLKSIFSANAEETDTSKEDIVSEAALRIKDPREKHKDFLQLSTIHQAKGLEFDYVFVVRVTQGILPSEKSLNKKTQEGVDEERRLAYVAFTRAKKRLYITSSPYMPISKNDYFFEESEFVSDIKKLPCVKVEEPVNSRKKIGEKWSS